MKKCPRCDKSYPDSETFCETDGTALVAAAPAFTQSAGRVSPGPDPGAAAIECPVCGGKAQPGELICNFCGARLGTDASSAPQAAPAQAGPTRIGPATGPRSGPVFSDRMTGRMTNGGGEEPPSRGGLMLVIYIFAAIVALGGGALLALHMSRMSGETNRKPVAEASPSVAPLAVGTPAASPGAAGPIVTLAATIPIAVAGDSSGLPQRNQDAARKMFETNQASLLDSYKQALASDSTLSDAMAVRIEVLPNGTVSEAAVRTSINPNPSLDAEIASDFAAWNFGPITGGTITADYPVIFANDPAAKAALESQLKTKLAALNPAEPPEYSSVVPSPTLTTAAEAAYPTAAAAPPAPIVAAPPPVPRKRAAHRPKPPPPTLQQKVKTALTATKELRGKFHRVDCYTSGSTVTIFGKVFDANAKALAERIVRQVPDVGNVIDSLGTDEEDWARCQNQIAAQLSAAGLASVTIKVIGHTAYLGGTVQTDLQKQQAATIAVGACPVHIGTNLITVLPGSVF
ncbi:MAG: BON domain-containing protein [Candidatus Binataceae bacterium]